MQHRQRKHLFFVNGPVPSEADYEAANELNGLVCFRNALMISPEEGCEDFDAVHGLVPAQYVKKARQMEQGEAEDDAPRSVPIGGDNGETMTTWKPNVQSA